MCISARSRLATEAFPLANGGFASRRAAPVEAGIYAGLTLAPPRMAKKRYTGSRLFVGFAMTSFRRVALSLGLVAACGGALVFSHSVASGAPKKTDAPTAPAALKTPATPKKAIPAKPAAKKPVIKAIPTPAATAPTPSGTANPTLKQTIGISPVQTGTNTFLVFGGDGTNTYDLQNENVYSLLRQSGVPIPNVLHPLSTAKPSFIIERLIVLSLTGGNNTANANASAPANSPRPNTPGAPTGTQATAASAPKPLTDAERTVIAVGDVVDAEITRGSGKLGGAHLQKLRYLSSAIRSLEAANRIGAGVAPLETERISGKNKGTAGPKVDAREIFYGQARLTSRAADRYAPTGL